MPQPKIGIQSARNLKLWSGKSVNTYFQTVIIRSGTDDK